MMTEPQAQNSVSKPDAWWLLLVFAAFVVIVVVAVATVSSDLVDQATAAVLAACVTGAVSVFIAGVGIVNRRAGT